jgi:hypothetical protein
MHAYFKWLVIVFKDAYWYSYILFWHIPTDPCTIQVC